MPIPLANRHSEDNVSDFNSARGKVCDTDEQKSSPRIDVAASPRKFRGSVGGSVTSERVRKMMEYRSATREGMEVPDIVEFSSEKYFCNEEEGTVELKVVRLGPCVGSCKVKWRTEDGSAMAGLKYVAANGLLEFKPAETKKAFQIELIGDDCFDTTLDFRVVLEECEGAMLGMYLHEAEVYIADDDTFPTNYFREDIQSKKYHAIAHWRLVLEYIKMHLKDKRFRRAFFANVFMDQIANLQMVWQILLMNYLIDVVLRPVERSVSKKDAHLHVLVIVLVSIIPHVGLLYIDQMKANKRIAGMATMKLQENLMRKFLNYTETSRSAVSTSDLTMAITRDVPELVQQGLLKVFPIAQKVGLLLCYGTISLTTSAYPWVMALNFILFPLLMVGFLRKRHPGTAKRHKDYFSCQTSIVCTVHLITDYYRLVEDYFQKQTMVARFREKVKFCNGAFTRQLTWTITNEHFAPFMTDLFCGIFILLAYQDVMDNGNVGEFVTGVGVWRGIGACYQSIYNDMMVVQHAVAPLHNVVHYMNLDTDTNDRLVVHRQLLSWLDTAEQASRAMLAGKADMDCPLVQKSVMIKSGDVETKATYSQDLIMISCQSLWFSYPECPPLIKGACFDIPQGKLVVLIGPRGSGKATLLQLIGQVLVPHEDSGLLFLPPHLRTLHVTHAPMVIHDMGLLQNLCFGPSDGADEDPKRVKAICTRLGMSEDAMQGVDEWLSGKVDFSKPRRSELSHGAYEATITRTHPLNGKGRSAVRLDHTSMRGTFTSLANRVDAELINSESKQLSHTDRCLIHIARAFVMNPEVLVIHKPMTHFDDLQAGLILELLREFVDMRGVEKTLEERKLSRPHTCIFSASALEGIEKADLVLQMNDGTVQEVDIDSLKLLLNRAKEMFKVLDKNGDGGVSRSEFLERIPQIPWAIELFGIDVTKFSREGLRSVLAAAYDTIDHGGNGEISIEEVVHYLRAQVHKHVPTVNGTEPKLAKNNNHKNKICTTDADTTDVDYSTLQSSTIPVEERLPNARTSPLGVYVR